MEITLYLKSFIGLVSILAILLFFLFLTKKSKKVLQSKSKKSKTVRVKSEETISLESLLQVIRDKHSTSEELSKALDLIIKYYGVIHPKLGIRSHPDFDVYGEILLRICRHPNTTKDIILKFDRALELRNEAYRREINDFLTKGLNSRGM